MFSHGLCANNIPKNTDLNKALIIIGLQRNASKQEWINMHKKFDKLL